jgi:hypothetical protein
MHPNKSRKAVLYGELAFEPNVAARYGPASKERMKTLAAKLAAIKHAAETKEKETTK